MIKIEDLKKTSCKAVSKIEKECFSDPMTESDILELLSEKGVFGYVAKVNVIVGYAIIMYEEKSIEIFRLGVFQKFRNEGAATKLLNNILSKLNKDRRTSAYIHVSDRNLNAHRFLQRKGFIAELEKDYFSDGQDSYKFTYTLQS